MPALTVGMATYDDFDGVWFTIQALRLYQDLSDVELLVVDNYGCDTTKNFLERWTQVRYVRATGVQGTAAPRDRVFREATGDAVLCCDSHVLFEPGVIARLKDWFAAHPTSRDLVQGPLVYDDLASVATHFAPVWQQQMWGTWSTDARGADRDGEAFDIPMQGLGAFACRRNAWVGFNPLFSGFGGEEGYLHEKFRQAGGRTLCLPWLRWDHRFGRPKGVTYRNTFEDRLRNYLIGHAELGLDLTPILQHFSEVLPEEVVHQVITQALWPEVAPVAPSGAGEPSLADLYAAAASTTSDINEHVPKLRELAEQCEHITEFGTRGGVSTTALVAGRPRLLRTYDLAHDPAVDNLRVTASIEGVELEMITADVLTVDLDPTDLLFIDTLHTAGQLEAELRRHAGQVCRWIAFHDTATFGERGEDGGPGLLSALRRFLIEQPEWRVVYHAAHNNGFTVISRDHTERVESSWDMAPPSEGLEDRLPFLVALCPTFGRRQLVENAIACFLAQDYPSERRRLLVLDDLGDLGDVDEATWNVVSQSERLPSLPAKYTRLVELALERWPEADGIVIWEDDDVYLPGHLAAHAQTLRSASWSKPSTILSTHGGTLHEEPSAGRFFASIGVSVTLHHRVGGFVETDRGDFDQQYMARLMESGGEPGDPVGQGHPTYVFRWESTGAVHAEQYMAGPHDETWYETAGSVAKAGLKAGRKGRYPEPAMDPETHSLMRTFAGEALPAPVSNFTQSPMNGAREE